jgi:hypothetical protein
VFFSRFFDRFLTLVFAVFAQHVQCTMYMYIVLYILYTGMNIGVHFILYRRIS